MNPSLKPHAAKMCAGQATAVLQPRIVSAVVTRPPRKEFDVDRWLAETRKYLAVIDGLVMLRRQGNFFALWVHGRQIRVQYQLDGPRYPLLWPQAENMVSSWKAGKVA